MDKHKHEWSTRYTKRFYADGVEWYCPECGANLAWPDAKRRVNAMEELSAETLEEAIELLNSYAGTSTYKTIRDALRACAEVLDG